MRIVGGRLKGKVLTAPVGPAVRPTGDRTREALFNVLVHRFQGRDGFSLEGAIVLDAFAGTGALGLEALSRGAARVAFLEQAPASLALIRANIAACRAEAVCKVVRGDACHPARAGEAATLALLDPPYGKGLALPAVIALAAAGWLAPGALVCVETEAKGTPAPPWPEAFEVADERTHGKARMTILRHLAPAQ
ncbi:16S rRNA (guanine(966)-N(2))-methyltransferase RsmD [Rhodospirillum rubrum]|uniref:16S rRNA (guanine(966)-N(2))-methyltransferase RsmD n=1 Tax=Rhodospirillum rubrum TaxID=1085 RepID=UPI0019071855|nr:16S rRNA (guanine(966)-N(2))-methyltransferase RsmD [Rhodospirillum rubrum]MBK1678554.1 16S rRNA (guanine(966)-N(2))-methyltransferase RsmD [Rhodospirillum rubrum]